jgi:hypothetical protein
MKTKVKAQELSISSKVYRYETGDESIQELRIEAIETINSKIVIRFECSKSLPNCCIDVDFKDTRKIYPNGNPVGYFFNYEDAREFALNTIRNQIALYTGIYNRLHAALNQAEDEI